MISVGSFSCCGMSWTEQESTGGEMREEKGFSFSDLGHMPWERWGPRLPEGRPWK